MHVALLVLLGLLVGLVVGGVGGGGGVVTVPLLVFVVGESGTEAATESLVIVGLASLIGIAAQLHAGHPVAWRTGIGFGVAGIPGAWVGTRLSQVVPERVLLLSFSVLTLVAAIGMLRRRRRPPRAGHHAPVPIVVAAGLGIGFLTGFFGVGGGFAAVPALVLLLGLPMQLTVGTSLLVVTINCTASLVSRLGVAHFHWAVIVPFALAAVVTTVLARRYAVRLHADRLQRLFGTLLLLVALYTAVQAV